MYTRVDIIFPESSISHAHDRNCFRKIVCQQMSTCQLANLPKMSPPRTASPERPQGRAQGEW